MPLVFSAITPHPPVLIPEIGKDNLKKISDTEEAMKKLEQEFYAAKPESVVIISRQERVSPDSFTINLSADYVADFKDFGDFSLELKFKSDYMTMQKIRSADESNEEVSIVLNSEQHLEHGFSVPLYFLTKHMKDIPVVPIAYSGLDYQAHYQFGRFLHDRLSEINKRFAVIASADLSHKLTKDSPAGFDPQGKEFDDLLVGLLKKNDLKGVAGIKSELAQAAGESGFRSIMVLLGVLESFNVETEVMSYEGPFGVGYTVANFRIK